MPDEAQNVPEQTLSTSPIEWADSNNIGVKALDDDHRALLTLLNRYRESAANDDRTECMTILERFKIYTKTHFQREEAVMAACAYPGLTNHAQVHGLLIKQVEKMQKQLNRGELGAGELVAFLSSWWVDHVQFLDQACAPYCEGNAELIKQALEQAGPALDEPEG